MGLPWWRRCRPSPNRDSGAGGDARRVLYCAAATAGLASPSVGHSVGALDVLTVVVPMLLRPTIIDALTICARIDM